ncbi:MAG TPA: YihY/virulence factor BrkB family protein [Blastocatellia bacterium]|nr:YihY/virulence factor BrkB family protein [Blastocatellia bacterium]
MQAEHTIPQGTAEPTYGPITTTIAFLKRVKPAISDLREDQVQILASAIAFNALLSFLPFLVLLLTICKDILQWNAGYEAVFSILRDYLPVARITADFIERNLRALTTSHPGGPMAIISLISLWITSAGTLIPIEVALNRAWGVKEGRPFIKRYTMVLLLVLISGLLMLGAVFISAETHTFLASVTGELSTSLPVKLAIWIVEKLATVPISVLIFLLIYYFLPNTRVSFRQVLPAAIFMGLTWEISKYLFAHIAPRITEGYGAFHVTVSLVLWAFVSALLMLLCANLSAQNLFPTFRRR